MYTHHLNKGIITRDADGVVVSPCQSADDPDYVAYCEWADAGNVPVDVEAAPTVRAVTPRQMRLALNALGLRATVEAAIASADQNTRDTWEFSLEVERDNPLVQAMGLALGKTEAELDALFTLASTL